MLLFFIFLRATNYGFAIFFILLDIAEKFAGTP